MADDGEDEQVFGEPVDYYPNYLEREYERGE